MFVCVCSVIHHRMTSNYGKNISDTLGYRLVCHLLFLPQLDVIYDLLLNKNCNMELFVNYTVQIIDSLLQIRDAVTTGGTFWV